MKLSIDESKLVDDVQYCVISYMNVKYLQGLFERLGIEAEIFDIATIGKNKDEFPDGVGPFWRMFYEMNPDDGNPEEYITVIRSHVNSEYLRELLASEDVRDDYYGAWGKENPDEPLDCYQAWNVYTDDESSPYSSAESGELSAGENPKDVSDIMHQLEELLSQDPS